MESLPMCSRCVVFCGETVYVQRWKEHPASEHVSVCPEGVPRRCTRKEGMLDVTFESGEFLTISEFRPPQSG